MSIENKNEYQPTERGEKLKKIAVKYVGTPALLLTVAVVGHEIANAQAPEFSGQQSVEVVPGDKLDNLINEHVDGGASHTGEVRAEVNDDPANADVFENGQLDPGEELELPEKVS